MTPEYSDAVALIRTVADAIRARYPAPEPIEEPGRSFAITLTYQEVVNVLAFDTLPVPTAVIVPENPDGLDWFRRQAQAMANQTGLPFLVLPPGRVRMNAGGSKTREWSPAVVLESAATEGEKGMGERFVSGGGEVGS